jgi:hypothetical protein
MLVDGVVESRTRGKTSAALRKAFHKHPQKKALAKWLNFKE